MIWSLLHAGLVNALLAALLAVLVALLARLLRTRPAVVHVLWLLVLLKFVTPPIVPLSLPWPEPTPAPAEPAEEEPTGAECPCFAAEPARVELVMPMPETPPVEPEPEPELPQAMEQVAPQWPELILGVWLTGTVVCWSVAGARLLRLCRALRGLPPASEEKQRIGRLAARLGLRCQPRAWLVPGVLPPMLLALGRSAWLLLPRELWQSLNETQRDTLLLHELAHLKRGDHRVRWLELVVLGLYWWHPAAWWASRALRDAEEQCCDAWVVWALPGAAQAYATTLVETIAWLSRVPVVLPAGASGAGPVRLLKWRLTMILRGRTPRSLSWPALAVVLVCGLGLLPVMPTMARSERPEAVTVRNPLGQAEKLANKPLIEQKACIACHQSSFSRPSQPKKVPGDLHAEVVRLLGERAALQKKLGETEKQLRDALLRFEKAQGGKVPPRPEDGRLESIEKKLKLLLDEVEGLRREMRKTKEAPMGKIDEKQDDAKQKRVLADSPTLKIYTVAPGSAEAMAKTLRESYKGSATCRISTAGTTKVLVYATPEDQFEIGLLIKKGTRKTGSVAGNNTSTTLTLDGSARKGS